MVKNRSSIWILGVILVLAPLAGCSSFVEKEPDKTIHAIVKTANDVADALHGVQDAATAQKAVGTLDQELSQLTNLIDEVPKLRRQYWDAFGDAPGKPSFRQSVTDAFDRIDRETERLENVPGLPVEFWKTLDTRMIALIMKSPRALMTDMIAEIKKCNTFGSAGDIPGVSRPFESGEAFNAIEYHCKCLQALQQQCGYERLVRIKFLNTDKELAKRVQNRLLELAAGKAMVFRSGSANTMIVSLGPVTDFTAFAAAIDFGDVVLKSESRRSLTVRVRPEAVEQWQRKIDESRKQSERAEEEKQATERAAESQRAKKQSQEEFSGGDPNDPNYYGKLAENMTSSNDVKRRQAFDILMKTSPSQVSAEAKRQIARAFKRLAEEGNGYEKEQAVKGLVIWGGKFSGPILLKMLEKAESYEQASIIQALGKIKYAGAAKALAEKLGDSIHCEEVMTALRRLGPDAEDALLAAAATQDTRACLAAIALLGDCGGEKSLPILRRGLANRDPDIRDALKAAIRKIVARQKATKTKDAE